jgi:membrane fusion protein (multidrug efflux system)
MTVHSTSSRPISRYARRRSAEALLPAAAPQVLTAKKLNLRKLLLTGAAVAALAGAAWYGWNYWTVGQYLVSTDDAYVKGRQHHHCAEGHRLPATGAGEG